MKRYKRFFQVPLNKLPWGLPLKKEKERKQVSENKKKNYPNKQTGSSTGGHSSRNIDQRLVLQILKVMQQSRSRSSNQNRNAPVFYVLSTKAGKAGSHSSNTTYEKLDSIYRDLAPQIHIRTNLRRKGLSLPVAEYGYENYDPKRHKISRVNFKRMRADPATPFKQRLGKIVNFQVPQHHHYINVPCGMGKKRFPDICLLLDTSGSMRNGGYHTDIPWGEKSGYHYALLGLYGIVKYLEKESIAPSILWNVINFSDATRASGWKSYREISQLKKHALTPQFGGTEIDVEVLREELLRKPCMVIVLSDGEIYNWERIKTEMEETIQPHYTCFIQIRKETKVGKDMRNFGAAVLTVKKKEDIAQLMVDLTKKVRHSF